MIDEKVLKIRILNNDFKHDLTSIKQLLKDFSLTLIHFKKEQTFDHTNSKFRTTIIVMHDYEQFFKIEVSTGYGKNLYEINELKIDKLEMEML